jgi:hypothetical protein
MASPTKPRPRPRTKPPTAETAVPDVTAELHPVAIAYADGTHQTIPNLYSPRVLIALEKEGYDDDKKRVDTFGSSIAALMYMAWTETGRPLTFEAWSESVVGFQMLPVVPFGRVNGHVK